MTVGDDVGGGPAVRWLSASETVELVRTRRVSPVELVTALLESIEAGDSDLHAFITVAGDYALDCARQSEAALYRGEPLGSLHGLPITVKDLEPTTGIRTTYGSTIYQTNVPDFDSLAVARLKAAGAIIVGKTNTPEFGLLGETKNRLVEQCCNPWDLTRMVGGSSGGAAAATAAGLGALALGSDGAGSIIAPAAFCGVYGFKPSHGRVPSWPRPGDSGLFVDAGPIARTVGDLRLALEALQGPDKTDPWSQYVISRRSAESETGARGRVKRILWTPDLGHYPVDSEIQDLARRGLNSLDTRRHKISEATLDIPEPWGIYMPIFWGDMSVALRQEIEQHLDEFLPEARAELEPSLEITVQSYVKALGELWTFQAAFRDVFCSYDFIAMPATAVPAFPLNQPPTTIAGRSVSGNWTTFMPFSVVANMTGCPAVSIPCGLTREGLPAGLLVIGDVDSDEELLEFASELERTANPAVVQRPKLAPDTGTGRRIGASQDVDVMDNRG